MEQEKTQIQTPIKESEANGETLTPNFGKFSILAFSIGTAIGWGSLVVTCGTYLAQAGILGTILGLVIGMLVILVVTRNLQYMICRNQDAGGIYSFARKVCGHDYGFLAAWFLLLTYMAILWANITSVPLFIGYFSNGFFKFGFHYHIFGYEVYLGEALLSICAIVLTGIFCARCRKAVNGVMVTSASLFVVGFTFCTAWALAKHGQTSFNFDPLLLPDASALSQIAKIAVISPWAFIGFENVAHFSEEYTFKTSKIRGILIVSVVASTALYILVTLLSVTAYPSSTPSGIAINSWFEYISHMKEFEGFERVPAFYAINHYLGNTGIVILMVALFGAILTSLIGNTMALSRLFFAAGRDGSAPAWLKKRNKVGNPSNAIWFIVLCSVLIPFLGRTAIGWIVDVTTLGATIIYALVSYAVFKDARKNKIRTEQTTGLAGLILMLAFILMILLPNLFSTSAMGSESYILFDIWAVLGLVYFMRLVLKDQKRQYGKSVLVWVIMLLFVLFASMMWVAQKTQTITDNTMRGVADYYVSGKDMTEFDLYLKEQTENIHSANSWYTLASFAIFIVAASIILINYQIMRRREEEYTKQLNIAKNRADTDQLTGIKNRHAYAYKEQELDARIEAGKVEQFAIVVCDINDLKIVNDQNGHHSGDQCISYICKLICTVFHHSPVFRVGGDEFVVVLEGEDFAHREELIERLNRESSEKQKLFGSTLAVGISDYRKATDESVLKVFTRADEMMYLRKTEMKKNKGI